MAQETYDAVLTSIHQMTPRVRQYILHVDDHTFDFKPGQHTVIRHEEADGTPAHRPYSPVNLPGTPKLALAIKRYDEGTTSVWMDEHTPGDVVTVTTLNGNLYLRDLDRDVVFCSTGTGITPMIAMLKQYLRDGTGTAHFFYGDRTQRDLMFRETLDHLAADHANLTVVYSLSHETWNGPTGNVQTYLDAYGPPLHDAHVYVCGVPQMVVDTQATLDRLGVPEDHVFIEGWESSAA